MTNWVISLWEIVWEVLGWFQICTFIDEQDEGVVKRFGKYHRNVSKGIAWHLPLELEDIEVMNVKPTALELEEQALTTRDNKEVTLRGVLMWSIFDIKKCMIDVEDAVDTLGDIAVGVIQEMVEQQDWAYIRSEDFRQDVKKAIQKQARKWGITVSTVKFQDLTEAGVYKLFGAS